MLSPDARDALLSIEPFGSCDPGLAAAIFEPVEFRAGGMLTVAGSPAVRLYAIRKGLVASRLRMPNGWEAVECLRPGTVVGDECLIGVSPYRTSAQALSHVSALAVDAQAIASMAKISAPFAYAIASRMFGRLERARHAVRLLAHPHQAG